MNSPSNIAHKAEPLQLLLNYLSQKVLLQSRHVAKVVDLRQVLQLASNELLPI